jgi:hypothetical protein
VNVIAPAAGLAEANYTAITPYLVPAGPKKVNVGDGFIMDSAVRLLGARPAAAFSSRVPLDAAATERINASRCLVAFGANTLKDEFELAPGFTLATLARIRVPVVLMGVGHYGVADLTRGFTPESVALIRALVERFPLLSVRCDASRRYVLQSLPELAEQVLMTSCPVLHAVDGIDRGFRRTEPARRLVVTVTDRIFVEEQLALLPAAAQAFPARERVLALHQDYGNRALWDFAAVQGFRVFRSTDCQDFVRLYAESDVHFGNRVHAHLKCLSLGVISFCTPFDLRQAYFAESLDCPLVERLPDAAAAAYDFSRVRARRDAARAAMDRFTGALLKIIQEE